MNATEDDTFNRLRKPQHDEMVSILLRSFDKWPRVNLSVSDTLRNYGWSMEEYLAGFNHQRTK